VSARFTVADLAASGVLDVGRNRQRLAEAAGLPTASMPACPPPSMPDGWLHRLMACGSFAGGLDPEQELSARVAAELRGLTRSGALRAVWSCHPAEVRVGGKSGQMLQSLLVFMGVVPGSSDFVFTWGAGAGWIELKVEERQPDLLRLRKDGRARAPARTYMHGRQPDFREWCLSLGVRHAVARSVPEVLATLREWGRL
jgi:hypothetical protein